MLHASEPAWTPLHCDGSQSPLPENIVHEAKQMESRGGLRTCRRAQHQDNHERSTDALHGKNKLDSDETSNASRVNEGHASPTKGTPGISETPHPIDPKMVPIKSSTPYTPSRQDDHRRHSQTLEPNSH